MLSDVCGRDGAGVLLIDETAEKALAERNQQVYRIRLPSIWSKSP